MRASKRAANESIAAALHAVPPTGLAAIEGLEGLAAEFRAEYDSLRAAAASDDARDTERFLGLARASRRRIGGLRRELAHFLRELAPAS
jgi:hypothetical protein